MRVCGNARVCVCVQCPLLCDRPSEELNSINSVFGRSLLLRTDGQTDVGPLSRLLPLLWRDDERRREGQAELGCGDEFNKEKEESDCAVFQFAASCSVPPFKWTTFTMQMQAGAINLCSCCCCCCRCSCCCCSALLGCPDAKRCSHTHTRTLAHTHTHTCTHAHTNS